MNDSTTGANGGSAVTGVKTGCRSFTNCFRESMSDQNIVELGACTARVGEWRGVDAVVFVHGIAGDFRDTPLSMLHT